MFTRITAYSLLLLLLTVPNGWALSIVPALEPVFLVADKDVYRLRLGDDCHVSIDFLNFSNRVIKYAVCDARRGTRMVKLRVELYRDGNPVGQTWHLHQPSIKDSTPLLNLEPGGYVRSQINVAVIYHGKLKPGAYELRVSYHMTDNPATGVTKLTIPEQTVAKLIVEK
jgi:hypothetical protein